MHKLFDRGKRRASSAVLAEDPISQFQAWLLDHCLARNLGFKTARRLETASQRPNSPF